MNEPININEASFEKAVLQSPIPVVVDFWAAWCGPCKMIAPLLDEVAKENGDRFRVAKVNIDDDPGLQQRFNIRGVPALLFFAGGELKDQIVGVASKKAIVDKLESLVRTGGSRVQQNSTDSLRRLDAASSLQAAHLLSEFVMPVLPSAR